MREAIDRFCNYRTKQIIEEVKLHNEEYAEAFDNIEELRSKLKDISLQGEKVELSHEELSCLRKYLEYEELMTFVNKATVYEMAFKDCIKLLKWIEVL